MSKLIRLNLGCGAMIKKGYINVDGFLDGDITKNPKFPKNTKFVVADIRKLPFPDNYADYVELSHVIEHLPFDHVPIALKEIYRVMKKGAEFVVLTNDFDGLVLHWLEYMSGSGFNLQAYHDLTEMFFGNQRGRGEYHLSTFNADYLNYVLVQAGFNNGEVGKIKRFQPFPPMREMNQNFYKNAVARNDQVYAIVKK